MLLFGRKVILVIEDKNRNCIHFRNSDIKSITTGRPRGHRHIRTILETEAGSFVFQEATVAAIVRAYINIKTHPQIEAVKLTGKETANRKKGYASYQLLEEDLNIEDLRKDMSRIIDFENDDSMP